MSGGVGDHVFDVVVAGSGAGGLAAAVTAARLGLKVLVLEKDSLYGGTTARSGGVLWVPCHGLGDGANGPDSPEAARRYLAGECGSAFDAEFNEGARRGEDPCFGRGSSAYNRYLGDREHRPNPCVAPIEQGPFHAIRITIGDLGTFAGIRTDGTARALDEAGRPIPGLYAAGNDGTSIMGGNYPGAGITLGPALTFGFVAGEQLASTSTGHTP